MSMEQFILSSLENIGQTNFDMIMKGIGLIFVLFWLLVVYWVAVDSAERSRNILFRIISSLMVLLFNVPGLIMYFLIRPRATEDEMYWANLERKYLKFETMDIGECPKCNNLYTPNYLMCPTCGYELRIKCAKCGLYNEKNWKYCPYCMERNENSVNEIVVNNPISKPSKFNNVINSLKTRLSSISIKKPKVQKPVKDVINVVKPVENTSEIKAENINEIKTVENLPKKKTTFKIIEQIKKIRTNWAEKRRIQKELNIEKAKKKEIEKRENAMKKANEKLSKSIEKTEVISTADMSEKKIANNDIKKSKKKNKNKRK
jgi:hypothetical protein